MSKSAERNYSDKEISELLAEARAIFFPETFPFASGADWLVEGGLGSPQWKTRNGGREYYDGQWHLTKNVTFDRVLPDYSKLTDLENSKCFETVQKWAFALRSGWLQSDLAPKPWVQACNWGLSFTAWVYVKKSEFNPTEFGFELVEKDDIDLLMEQLAIGGWAHALKIIERTFTVLYKLAFGEEPSSSELSKLPSISPDVLHRIVLALETAGCFIQREKSDQKIVSRIYLADKVGCTSHSFDALSVRHFLRQFENFDSALMIMLPGKRRTAHPNVKDLLIDKRAIARPTKQALTLHGMNCIYFWSAGGMPGIGLPNIVLKLKELLKDFQPQLDPSEHQILIPLSQALASLNEAALWITQYGDDFLDVFANHLVDRAIIDIDYKELEYCARFKLKQKAFSDQTYFLDIQENHLHKSNGLVASLGLVAPHLHGQRQPIKGALSLTQGLHVLIGACAYAIAVMKPMRDGELAMLEYDCVQRNSKTGGCFLKVPVEKAGELGLLDEALRPIPYLTYKAITIMQRLGDFTARFFYGDSARPTRLFYFPGREGFSPPIDKSYKTSIDKCMDWFCEYINFPLDEYGRRHYFRVHELRKFYLLMQTWDDRLNGWECGAWMATHKKVDHMQAYTEANMDGAEISEWEAEYVEDKLLDLELQDEYGSSSDIAKLYIKVKNHFKVSRISSLPSDKFRSYLKSMLDSGRYQLIPITLPGLDGQNLIIDLAVIAKETVSHE